MTEDYRDVLSITDDEDAEFDEEYQVSELSGVLSKWTNYIQGWQDRFIVVKNGTISYYKSEEEASVGCRGTVSLCKAVISAHEFDDCRFDIGFNDCLWYLRASSSDERRKWMNVLELHKQGESDYGSENSLRRHGSHLSLTSTTNNSTASASSFKRGRGLREKLAEMETYKDILTRQVDSLQNYFDACASALAHYSVHDIISDDDVAVVAATDDYNSFRNGLRNPSDGPGNGHHNHASSNVENHHKDGGRDLMNILRQHGAHAVDFRGESLTFKATTAGTLTTLGHCIDLINQREEAWKKRMDKEVEKRKRLQESYRQLLAESVKPVIKCGPDYEEGPHSMWKEEEFFDALDATLDQLEQEEKQKLQIARCASKVPKTCLDPTHPLYGEINKVVDDHIRNADMSASDVADTWTLVASEGEMRIYKKEEPDGGCVYPLKAVHSVKGITAHELCHYFWEPSVRLEWETTLQTTQVLEWLSTDTHITYQLLKRVWPISPRDSVFWSTIRHCPAEGDDQKESGYWIVANHSTERQEVPSGATGPIVRLIFSVAMICQTVVEPPANGGPITRDCLTCRIQYSAAVNPGGSLPAPAVRLVCTREAPKFLKKFTSYVIGKTENKPIMF